MSFTRISTLALALAAGLALPASAATYNVSFSLDGGNVGSGTFTVADGTTLPGKVATFSFSLSLSGNGGTFTYVFAGDQATNDLLKPAFGFNGPGGAAALAGNNIETSDGDNLMSLGVPGGWNVTSLLGFECTGEDDSEDFINRLCFDQWSGTYTITRSQEPEDTPVIPLPATAALLPLGLVALGALRRRKKG